MDKNEKILFGAVCFLGGIAAGFLVSPVKKGVYLISIGGNRCRNELGKLSDSTQLKRKKYMEDEGNED